MLTAISDGILQEEMLSDTIINSLPGIFYLYNDKLELLLWNKNFEAVLGYTPQELKNMPVLELIAPEDRNAVQDAIQTVFAEGYHIIEACAISKLGVKIPFFFTGRRLIYEGQRCLLGTGIDISSRLHTEKELRTSEQKYKLLFESNPAPMWMIAKDDLSIIAANDAAANLYGYTTEELLTMKATAFRPAEDLALQQERYKQTLKPAEPTLVRHLKKDGSTILVNIYAFDCMFDDRPARLSITHNITEQLKAEDKLQRSEANLQTILNTTDTVYALFNLNLETLAFNQRAAQFVFERYHHVLKKGDYLPHYFPADRFPEFTKNLQQVLKGDHLTFERLLPYPDGSERWFYIRLSPIDNDAGDAIGVMITLHDITENKKAEDSLKTAYLKIQDHMNSIKNMAWKQSHVIRSPLANLKGLVTLLRTDPADPDVITHIETELERMDNIIIEMARDASAQE